MKTQHFDTIIIGSGTSAFYAAQRLSEAGRKVALIEKREFGGTCALRGCQPKKFLVANAEAVSQARQLVGRGIKAAPETDWQALQRLKNSFLDTIPERSFEGYRAAGITLLRGEARMISDRMVVVGNDRLEAEHIIVATGSRPRRSRIPGWEHAGTSDTFLELPELPERVVFVGAGFISLEFASVAAAAGSLVTILHRNERPLREFDPEAVAVLFKALGEFGIETIPNEEPWALIKEADGITVRGKSGRSYQADLVIEATGRVPELGILDGDGHGVKSGPNGVVVNEYLQSVSNPRVYAIGDVADTGYQLASTADRSGLVAAENILNGNSMPFASSVVARSLFTFPNLARVGMTENEARARGIDFRILRGSTCEWPSSLRIGEQHSFYKILVENGTGRILGADIVRHLASEVINTLALAIRHRLTVRDLKSVLWAYPTMTSDLNQMLG